MLSDPQLIRASKSLHGAPGRKIVIKNKSTAFHARRRTEKIGSPKVPITIATASSRQAISSMSKPLTARTGSRATPSNGPESFLFLGRNGEANALENQLYSARSTVRVVKNNKNQRKLAFNQYLAQT